MLSMIRAATICIDIMVPPAANIPTIIMMKDMAFKMGNTGFILMVKEGQ
ncbi:MAG TPA: hypothetical protein VKA95_13925 [Nitrososphaeraceae archaeon]|nr:hypothetical protein [Nitrososphaeraceae archaeon]